MRFLGHKLLVIVCCSALLIGAFLIIPIAQALNTHSIDIELSSSQYISIADGSQTGLDLSGNFTLEAWVKFESAPGTDQQYEIISKQDPDAGAGEGYRIHYRDDGGTKKLRLVTGDSSVGDSTLDIAQTLTPGTWYHIAATVSGTTGTIFVNGSSIGTGTVEVPSTNSLEFRVGANPNNSRYFDGLVDDVRVWNTARSATEIADDMDTELNGNESGLVGYWKLNNSLEDLTSNNNDLTNNNSATFSADAAFSGFVEDLSNRKSINENVSNSTVLQDDDELKLALAANKTYVVDGVIFASSTSATPDIIIAFTGQTGASIRVGYTNDVNEMVLDSGDQSSRINLPANTPTSIHIKGTVVTSSTSGDFKLKWAQATSNAASTTVMAGSYLRAEEI